MQFSQSALFRLCCASFVAGLFLSAFYDLLYATRLWLIPSCKRYTVPAIQKIRSPRVKKKGDKPSPILHVTIFFEDVLFCLISALVLILLLYWQNNGKFRAAAPLCMAVAFWLFQISASKGVRVLFQWFAFGIESLVFILCKPIRCVCRLLFKTYRKHAQKIQSNRLFKQRKKNTEQELLHIEKAVQALLPNHFKNRMQKGEERAKHRKKAV